MSLDAELECNAAPRIKFFEAQKWYADSILEDPSGWRVSHREHIFGTIKLLVLSFGVAMPSGEWLGSRTDEGRAKLR